MHIALSTLRWMAATAWMVFASLHVVQAMKAVRAPRARMAVTGHVAATIGALLVAGAYVASVAEALRAVAVGVGGVGMIAGFWLLTRERILARRDIERGAH